MKYNVVNLAIAFGWLHSTIIGCLNVDFGKSDGFEVGPEAALEQHIPGDDLARQRVVQSPRVEIETFLVVLFHLLEGGGKLPGLGGRKRVRGVGRSGRSPLPQHTDHQNDK